MRSVAASILTALTFIGWACNNTEPGHTTTSVFSHPGGFCEELPVISAQSTEPGRLFYTLDGSLPIPGNQATSEFPLSLDLNELSLQAWHHIPTASPASVGNDHTWFDRQQMPLQGPSLRVARYDADTLAEEAFATYLPAPIDWAGAALPVVAITVDTAHLFNPETGIYVPGNRWDPANPTRTGNSFGTGRVWERPAHFQYFTEDGELGYASNCAIRIQGQVTPAMPQKSLKLIARYALGNAWFKYPFFEPLAHRQVRVFDRLVLRSAWSGWSGGIYKDALASESVRGLRFDYMRQKPVFVFINGAFWGIQFLAEVADERFARRHYSVDKDSVNIVSENHDARKGDATDWNRLRNFMATNDLANDAHYKRVAQELDIPAFIDYIATEVYFQNMDWPCNNQRYWRAGKAGKWRPMLVDLDATISNPNHDWFTFTTEFHNDDTPNPANRCNVMLRALLRNAGFRAQFEARCKELAAGPFSRKVLNKRVQEYFLLYNAVLPAQQARWHYPDQELWEKNNHEVWWWADKREPAFLTNLDQFMQHWEAQAQLPMKPIALR